MTPRVVLDTNVYVSALRYGGKPKQVVDYARDGMLQVLISTPLRLELERILRDKFSYSASEIAATASFLWSRAMWVVPHDRLDLCPDKADNRVLECALAGGAEFIVTGDHHLLDLPSIQGLAILSPNDFLACFNPFGRND
jgi:putative PIN family toxin of toxin-antitoxin system